MNHISEPPERSGGIDFDQSDVQAQDVIGRDKIEFKLPPIARRGCYAQLSENIRFAVFLGVVLLLIYVVFASNSLRVAQPTPTPTAVETATPAQTPEPLRTPPADSERSLQQTVPAVPPIDSTLTVVSAEEGTPVVPVTATDGPLVAVSPTPAFRRATASATPSATTSSTPVVRPPTPTSRPTPTPVPPSATPSPEPAPTSTPRPPTPTPNPCPSASVRVGPVAKLVTEGDGFAISVLISCAVDLAGYQVELRFDPAVVAVRDANDGGFLASAGGSVFVAGLDVDNSAGKATIGAVVLRPGPYPSGSGTLASFGLEAIHPGSTDLDAGVSLSDVNGQSIPVGVSDGAVVIRPRATTTPSSP